MLGTPGKTCPECGCTVKRDSQWRRTRRRWKTASAALLASVFIAVGPFWKALLVLSVDYLPDTALIMLTGRISFDEPYPGYVFDNELRGRLQEGPDYCVSRWNRAAMWRWQWRLLAGRDEPEMAYLQQVAEVFAQPPPARQALVVTQEEMLALDHDATGTRVGALQERLQLPRDTFLVGYEDSLGVKWLDLKAADGAAARLYLISSMQLFALFALRREGDEWVFGGAYDIHSKYADPELRVLAEDETICELGSISTGGTGTWRGLASWCRVDDTGLRFVHGWATGGNEYWSNGPFNYEFSTAAPSVGRDERGMYVDHAITLTITNADVSWTLAQGDPADAAAVADLADVFQRAGVARYRWDDGDERFVLSESESAWTDVQVQGSFYDDTLFITQNFDTLVNLATGDDPARRAWVRLALTRLEESAAKRRLIQEIRLRPAH